MRPNHENSAAESSCDALQEPPLTSSGVGLCPIVIAPVAVALVLLFAPARHSAPARPAAAQSAALPQQSGSTAGDSHAAQRATLRETLRADPTR